MEAGWLAGWLAWLAAFRNYAECGTGGVTKVNPGFSLITAYSTESLAKASYQLGLLQIEGKCLSLVTGRSKLNSYSTGSHEDLGVAQASGVIELTIKHCTTL